MKLNISYPANGSQKIVEIDDERKLRPFMEKRMGTEVSSLDINIQLRLRGMMGDMKWNERLIGVFFE